MVPLTVVLAMAWLEATCSCATFAALIESGASDRHSAGRWPPVAAFADEAAAAASHLINQDYDAQ